MLCQSHQSKVNIRGRRRKTARTRMARGSGRKKRILAGRRSGLRFELNRRRTELTLLVVSRDSRLSSFIAEAINNYELPLFEMDLWRWCHSWSRLVLSSSSSSISGGLERWDGRKTNQICKTPRFDYHRSHGEEEESIKQLIRSILLEINSHILKTSPRTHLCVSNC